MTTKIKCPHCGRMVDFEEKGTGKGKKIGSTAAGAAIGSFVFPFVGTAIGGGLGYWASRFLPGGKGEVKCPYCGGNLFDDNINENKLVDNDSNNDDFDEGHAYFQDRIDYYFDNVEEILKDENSVLKFVDGINSSYTSDMASSELLFMKSWAILQYLHTSDSSNKGKMIDEGCSYIKRAYKLMSDDEYLTMLKIYGLYKLEGNDSISLSKIKDIKQSCPSILKLENTFIKPSYMQDVFNNVYESVLYDAWNEYKDERKNNDALECLSLMSKIETNFSQIVSHSILSDYYSKNGDNENPELFFYYAKKVVESVKDFEYDKEIPYHKLWLEAVVHLSYCYSVGYGTVRNDKLGYEYSQKAADLGNHLGINNLANCYEDGMYVAQDKHKALELYQKALAAGCENASEDIERLSKELNIVQVIEPKAGQTKKREHDIFISYSRKDKEIVDEFVEKFEKEGYRVWIDRDGIESGDMFKSVIVDAIESCQVVIYFSSEPANSSEWTAKEIGIAVDSKKEIIPIRLDRSKYSKSVRLDLINIDFIDYTDENMRQACEAKLFRALKDKIVKGQPKTEDNADLTEAELKFFNMIKKVLEENGEISERERKIQAKICERLGITNTRAKELEDLAKNSGLNDDEKDYLESYRSALADGEITSGVRRSLDDLLSIYEISEERAKEIEKMA